MDVLRKEKLEAERDELLLEFSGLRMIGRSPALTRITDTVRAASRYDSAVLIQGETGTGKELVARAIHFNSNRKTEPFMVVNCAAIPEALVESELFGHEKGAFTGAIQQKKGKFELAYYHRPKRGPKSPDKKRPLIERDALRRLSAYFMKRLSYSCPVLR